MDLDCSIQDDMEIEPHLSSVKKKFSIFISIPPDFSVEVWACIEVIKTCRNIDYGLKKTQALFKKNPGNELFNSYYSRIKYIELLKKIKLLPSLHQGVIDYTDIVREAIINKYDVLSMGFVNKPIIKTRIQEQKNKILMQSIISNNRQVFEFLIKLAHIKHTIPNHKNKILNYAVFYSRSDMVNALLSHAAVRETAHTNDNSILFQALKKENVQIIQKLMNIPDVKKNLHLTLPRIYEFLTPQSLAIVKAYIGLSHLPQSKIIEYAITVSKAGHVLGLSNQHLPPDINFPMNFSGTYDSKAIGWVTEKLSVLLEVVTNRDFKNRINIILAVFKTSEHHRNRMFDDQGREKFSHTVHKDLLNDYLLGKMVHLLAGWKRHKFSIILYRGKISVTNRGEYGDLNFGTKIYDIANPAELTADWIKRILTSDKSEVALATLVKVIGLNKPLIALPQHPQKYPNCAYANKIAAMEAILLLLRTQHLGKLSTAGGLSWVYKLYKRVEYKYIVNFFRDQEINKIISTIKHNYFNIDLMYDLVRSIIIQHPGKTNKKTDPSKFDIECSRARELLKALPENYREKFKERYADLYYLIAYEYFYPQSTGWILVDYRRKRDQPKEITYPVPQSQKTVSVPSRQKYTRL